MSEVSSQDQELLTSSPELAMAQCEDLAPDVFARFFERCPAARPLFTVPDATMPPLGCGQLVFEVISLLLDSGAGKPSVGSHMHQIANEHVGVQVKDSALYTEFMAALTDVLADLLGPQWNSGCAQAWARQSGRLLASLPAIAAPA